MHLCNSSITCLYNRTTSFKQMNYLIKSVTCILMLFFLFTATDAQVKDIKDTARDDKKSSSSSKKRPSSHSSSSYTDEESFGDALAGEVFMGLIKGISFITYEAQRSVLWKREQIPNLISLESKLDYGTNFSELTFHPSIRANWGLFATDFRYALLHDYTGSLQSLDWQVLILRIPIHTLKLNIGAGFTSLTEPQNTYFESSTGFDLNLFQNQLNFNGNFRWIAPKTKKSFRNELKFSGDYLIHQKGHFHLYPSAGITYQEYYNRDRYLFFNIGLKIRIASD